MMKEVSAGGLNYQRSQLQEVSAGSLNYRRSQQVELTGTQDSTQEYSIYIKYKKMCVPPVCVSDVGRMPASEQNVNTSIAFQWASPKFMCEAWAGPHTSLGVLCGATQL